MLFHSTVRCALAKKGCWGYFVNKKELSSKYNLKPENCRDSSIKTNNSQIK